MKSLSLSEAKESSRIHAWNDTPPPSGSVEIGVWYWMKAWIDDDVFRGKIWTVDEGEPADWLLESALDFGAGRDNSGTVALNGGSSSGDGSGLTTVTFDNFAVCDNPEDCVSDVFLTPVEVNGKLPVIWGELKHQK